jgi:hypothetical protein
VSAVKTKTRRLAPGAYEIDTEHGTFSIDRITNEYGDSTYTEWFITWPNRRSADAVCSTLAAAKAVVEGERHVDQELNGR